MGSNMMSYERLEFIGDAILDFCKFTVSLILINILMNFGNSGDPPHLRSGQRAKPGSTYSLKGSEHFAPICGLIHTDKRSQCPRLYREQWCPM